MRRAAGLTLVEVLIALVVLAIGVMSAAALQASALRANSKAEGLRDVTRVAQSELAWERYSEVAPYVAENPTPIAGVSTYAYRCVSILPANMSCTFEVLPCNIVSGALTCARNVVSPLAYQIEITATDPRGDTVTLSSVTTGSYVAGTGGSDGVTDPSAPPPTTDPPPDTTPDPTPEPAPCVQHGNHGVCK